MDIEKLMESSYHNTQESQKRDADKYTPGIARKVIIGLTGVTLLACTAIPFCGYMNRNIDEYFAGQDAKIEEYRENNRTRENQWMLDDRSVIIPNE